MNSMAISELMGNFVKCHNCKTLFKVEFEKKMNHFHTVRLTLVQSRHASAAREHPQRELAMLAEVGESKLLYHGGHRLAETLLEAQAQGIRLKEISQIIVANTQENFPQGIAAMLHHIASIPFNASARTS